MFDFFKKKTAGIIIGSPMEGEAVDIHSVSDPTFGEEIMGKGVAVKPSVGRAVAPVDGTVTMVFETKHAICITTKDGVELLIHIGLDTVELKGEYYKTYVQADSQVKAGDLLVEFDMDKIKEAGYDLITPIVICNSADYSEIKTDFGKSVKPLDKILTIVK